MSPTLSTLEVDHPFGAPADGLARVRLTVTVRDEDGRPVGNRRVLLEATGSENVLEQPPRSDALGVAVGALGSHLAERKTVSAVIDPGPEEVRILATVETRFVDVPPMSRFVSQSGDDANSGASPIDAWRTLGHAGTVVQPGETVYVGAGTYRESVEIMASGTKERPIVFRGDTEGCYTGDPGRVVVDAVGATHAFRLAGRSYVVLRGFTVTGAVASLEPSAAIWLSAPLNEHVVLFDNEAYGNETGIRVDLASDVVLEGNRVSNNLAGVGDGIVLTSVVGADVANNLVYNNAGTGLRLEPGAMEIDVRANTLYANVGAQIVVTDPATVARISGNVISEGLDSGIRLPGSDQVDESFNLVWGHGGPDLEEGGAGTTPTGVIADPQFTDPAGPDGFLGGFEGLDDDFRLDTASPALDAGSAPAVTSRLAVGGPLSILSSRADDVLDGTSPDGAVADLGRHRAFPADPASSLSSGSGRLLWGSSSDVRVRARVLEPGSWQEPLDLLGANQGVEWVLHRTSPVDETEVMAALADLGTETDLVVRQWNGCEWQGENPFDPIESGIAVGDSDQRGFDLEFEQTSGRALLVVADGTSNPRYRILEDGAWSLELPVFAVAPATQRILWVELVPRLGTDELALVILAADQTLSAALWDGSGWEAAPTVLDRVITTTRISRAFDAAFESLSGDLLVVWGHTTLIEEARYAVRDAATGTWTPGLINAAEATTYVVRLASDPATDRIVGAFAEATADDDTVGFVWNGSSFGDIVEFDLDSGDGQLEPAVGWVGSTGVAVLTYKDNDGGGTLSWARFSNGWRRRADVAVPGLGDQELALIRSLPGDDRLTLVVADQFGAAYGLSYDGTDWTVQNGGLPLATGLPVGNGSARPFDLDLRP